jgi:RNA-directed DNA polymerase
MQGQCFLRRLADDGLSGCALAADARRVRAVLPKRVARFRLTMHPEKTAVMAVKQLPSREPSARGTGALRLARLSPLWGHDTPWRLGHQAPDGRATAAPV